MTASIRLVDGATTIWIRSIAPARGDPIICQNSEVTWPPPRVVDQEYADADGRLDLTSQYDGAQFKAAVKIFDSGGVTRHQTIDMLRAALAPAKRPMLYVQRDGWLRERQAVVRGDAWSCVIDKASAAVIDASLQVAIPGGYLEDTVAQTAVIRPTSTAATGRSYTKTYPWAYTPANSGSAATVFSAGNVATPPVIRLYGACTEPVITNSGVGIFELDNLSLAAGQYLAIDFGARTVLLNDDPAHSYYDRINFTTSTWWRLQSGSNQISVAVATADASCEVDITYRDRWI